MQGRWNSGERMRFESARFKIVACFMGLAVSAFAPTSFASETYDLARSDSYGADECLASGGECGQVVADAWCAAQGRTFAVTFGPENPAPRSTGDASAGAIRITCAN
jgi:hypothetical protein